jgi:4-hydroxy-tetrahydrodipicolinate reductase
VPDHENIRIALSGASGRMGRAIARLAEGVADLTIVGGIGRSRSAGVLPVDEAGKLLPNVDVLIDVSAADQLAAILRTHAHLLTGRALVVGTTGLYTQQETALDELAGRAAVLVAANFSPGVNLLLDLVRRAAAVLAAQDFDAEIVEAHHRAKADAPSGTAIALAGALAEGRGEALEEVRRDGRSGRTGARPSHEIGLHSIRGGGVVGDHRVLFLGSRERIEIAHAAMDRDIFAEGALAAARWLAGRAPGRYSMADVIGMGV